MTAHDLLICASTLLYVASFAIVMRFLDRAPEIDPDDQAGWSDREQAEWRMMRHGAPPSTFTEAE